MQDRNSSQAGGRVSGPDECKLVFARAQYSPHASGSNDKDTDL